MKKIAIISPLRGTPEQFARIEERISDLIKAGATPEAASKLHAKLRVELFHANQMLAERLCREVILAGHRPVAGHLFYPRFLDDAIEMERNLGMEAGRLDFAECAEGWLYEVHGISTGMQGDVLFLRERGVIVYTPPSWAPLKEK